MFNRIPSDVVEIVVVYSRSYDLFIKLKEIVAKFNDECVDIRIRDKLTEKHGYHNVIYFKLGSENNREYNKPYYVSLKYQFAFSYLYARTKKRLNIDLPYRVGFEGLRVFNSRTVDIKGCIGYVYRIGNNNFYESGYREIGLIDVNILEL